MADMGTATIKVIPDVSQIEPAIRAELARIVSGIGEVGVEELAAVLYDEILPAYSPTDPNHVAEKLLERFTILHKPKELEPDADES